jgi:hypothetical protein
MAAAQTVSIRVRSVMQAGRLKVDIPVDLPDNTEVELAEVPGDGLDEEDPLLEAALDRSMEQIARGETISAEEVIERLRARRPNEALPGAADDRG